MYICSVKQLKFFEIMNGKNEVALKEDKTKGLQVFNLLDESQLAKAEVFLKRIIASDKSGIKSIPDGLAVLMRAQDLQLPFSTCLEHIHVINGKTGVDVHLIKTLLLRAGVTWKCIKDYTPLYQYTDGNNIYLETQLPSYCVKCTSKEKAEAITTDDVVGVYPLRYYKDLKNNVYNEFQINDKCIIALNALQAVKLAQEGKFPVIRVAAQPVDFIYEYEFTRYRMINGKERVMTTTSHFSYNEAQTAELFEKDTYKKYARILISHRAFTLGARDIGADLLMGVLESSELKIMEGVNLEVADCEVIE